MKVINILILMCIFSGSVCAQEEYTNFKATKTDLQKYIKKAIKANKIQGLSIALVDSQGVIWSEGFGFADIKRKIRATDSTIYRVASLSKLITALGVMQEVEREKIEFDKPINLYLPEFSMLEKQQDLNKISVNLLLTHHSGLPSDVYFDFFSFKPIRFDKILDLLKNQHLTNQPGTILSYSNAGYSVLGTILERVSSQSFFEYTRNLLSDLHMPNSTFEIKPLSSLNFSKAYMKSLEINEPIMRDIPAGGLTSNVLDLSRLIRLILNKGKLDSSRILKSETIEAMLSIQNANCTLDFGTQIGLGWFINEDRNKWLPAGGSIGHNGDTWLFHSKILILPKQNLGVVVLSNSIDGIEIVDEIAQKILTNALSAISGIELTDKQKAPKINIIKLTSQKLKFFEGDYSLDGSRFSLIRKKEKLILRNGFYNGFLLPNDNGSFTPAVRFLGLFKVKSYQTQVKFLKRSGLDLGVVVHQNDTLLVFKKLAKIQISAAWEKRLGKYKDSLPTDFPLYSKFELLKKDGFLTLKMKMFNKDNLEIILRPISDNEAIVDGIGRGTGGIISVVKSENKEVGLQYSGLILKKQKH